MFFYDGEFGKKCLDQYGIQLLIRGRKHTPSLLVFITFFDAVGSRPTQITKSLIPFYNVIKKIQRGHIPADFYLSVKQINGYIFLQES